MRKVIPLFVLVLAFLVSCKPVNNPPKQEDRLPKEELQELLAEYAQYVSENYNKGDVVVFETEKGEFEKFGVQYSYTTYGYSIERMIDDEEEDGTASEFVENYGSSVTLRALDNTSLIGAWVGLTLKGELVLQCKIETTKAINEAHAYMVEALSPTDNQLLLRSDDGWCMLERNVGIICAADTLGHTWKLVQQE